MNTKTYAVTALSKRSKPGLQQTRKPVTGEVTVWFEGKEITNLSQTLAYVFRHRKTGKPGPLEFRYDPSVAVANGGFAMGQRPSPKKEG